MPSQACRREPAALKVLSVVGARPQFVKAGVLSRSFAQHGIVECLVHTGQHYDYMMSKVFFEELALPQPAYSLEVGSGSHGAQTGDMLRALEPVVVAEAPDWVLVYGDTNSTLAGAITAAKLNVPLAHVEAGMRSFNRRAPEEVNRVLADHVTDLHLVSNELARENLAAEGITAGVVVVGDLMVDLALETARTLAARPAILGRFGVEPGGYALATIHRAANTADAATFGRLIEGIRGSGIRTIFPVHPRTAALARELGVGGPDDSIVVCEPVSYVDMIALQRDARVILTDSGGVQKEAFILDVPCVTMRDETEWVQTLDAGWNVLTGSDPGAIARAARRPRPGAAGRYEFPFVGECGDRVAAALLAASARREPAAAR
jgi:UDP-GlcNAc3NAcA epimerase